MAKRYIVQWVDPKTRVLKRKVLADVTAAGALARLKRDSGALMASVSDEQGIRLWEPDYRPIEYQLGKMKRDPKTGVVTVENPKGRRKVTARKKNPPAKRTARAMKPKGLEHTVHHMLANGKTGPAIASFESRAEAEKFGRAYANVHNKPLAIMSEKSYAWF